MPIIHENLWALMVIHVGVFLDIQGVKQSHSLFVLESGHTQGMSLQKGTGYVPTI